MKPTGIFGKLTTEFQFLSALGACTPPRLLQAPPLKVKRRACACILVSGQRRTAHLFVKRLPCEGGASRSRATAASALLRGPAAPAW